MAAPTITLNLGECDSCGAPNRVLHRCVVYGIDTSACAACRRDPLSDDITDLHDEIDRKFAAGDWTGMMELHAALTEALCSAICAALNGGFRLPVPVEADPREVA